MSALDEPHFEAIKARLQSSPRLVGKVFDTVRRDSGGVLVTDENYLVLFGGRPAELGQDRLIHSQVPDDDAVFDFVVRGVGVDPGSAAAMLREAAGLLVAWAPVVAGRFCRPVRFMGGDQIRPDGSVMPSLYFGDDEYELRSFFRNGS